MSPLQGALISPADLLAAYLSRPGEEPLLFLVTGSRGSGKTSWCLELMRQARAAGIEPVGLVSPAVFDGDTKTGIDLVCVASGERRRLAVKRPLADSTSPDSPGCTPGLPELDWQFYPDVLAWGNQVLKTLPPGELLIVDELGPLEFLEQVGFTAGLEQIDQKYFRLTCAVVRPVLLPTALARWPWARVILAAGQPGDGEQP